MPSKRLGRQARAITSFEQSPDKTYTSNILAHIDVQGMDAGDEDEDDDRQIPPEDLKAFNDDTHVSSAPLHLMYSSTRNISQAYLDRLNKSGINIRRGKWSDGEIRRLKKNWNWICKHYPSFGDAAAAFGIWTKTDSSNKAKTRKRYAKFNLIRRMAYKLDDRLICDIHEKGKKLIGFKTFKHRSAIDVSDDVRDKILEDIKVKDKFLWDISCEYDVSPVVVDHIKRFSKSNKRHKWSAEDDLFLESSIERQLNNDSDIYSVKKQQIDWAKVRADLSRCGLHMTESQIYSRWYRKVRNNNEGAVNE